jgi:hypothetical protein
MSSYNKNNVMLIITANNSNMLPVKQSIICLGAAKIMITAGRK